MPFKLEKNQIFKNIDNVAKLVLLAEGYFMTTLYLYRRLHKYTSCFVYTFSVYFDTITIIQLNIYPLGQQIHDYGREA